MARRSGNLRGRAVGGGGRAFYSRGALCSICGISEHQLILWEREELVTPAAIEEFRGRSEPLYDSSVLERVRLIRILGEELEVNLPGIGIILNLLDRVPR